jgi:hypothetical protein
MPVAGSHVTSEQAPVGGGSEMLGFEQTPVAGLHVPAEWQASEATQVVAAPEQTPERQASFDVHALPSLQIVPSAIVGLEHAPVPGSHVPATWHESLAVQATAFPPVQTPDWHASLCVHAFPSLHAVPFAAVGFEHVPVPGSHDPATWHASDAVQVRGVPPAQVPLWHASPSVHALPSVHAVPFVATGFEHAPVDGLHVPTVWHWSLAVHVTGFDPVHTPLWHASASVHAFPSLHVVPFVAAGFEHAPVPGSHVPAVWH